MKNLWLGIFVLSGCIGYIMGSEQPMIKQELYKELNKPVEIFVSFRSDERKLYYVGENKMNYFKQKHANNSPCFINCEYKSTDLRTNLSDLLDRTLQLQVDENLINNQYQLLANSVRLQKITKCFDVLKTKTVIPLRYFLNDNDQFKQKGDVLFSFFEEIEKGHICFEIKLDEDLSKIKAQDIITTFCNKASWLGEDEEELQRKTILHRSHSYLQNTPLTHGSNSYKTELDQKYKAELDRIKDEESCERDRQQTELKQKKVLLYSRIKKFCGLSIAAILMYILYQKFYATTE